MYRQMRPYRKVGLYSDVLTKRVGLFNLCVFQWTCPHIEISEVESAVWNDLKSNSVDIDNAVVRLTSARDAGVVLSGRSLDLISYPEVSGSQPKARQEYVNEMINQPYNQQTLITCMDTLKKHTEDADALSLLVVGTEAGQVHSTCPNVFIPL